MPCIVLSTARKPPPLSIMLHARAHARTIASQTQNQTPEPDTQNRRPSGGALAGSRVVGVGSLAMAPIHIPPEAILKYPGGATTSRLYLPGPRSRVLRVG